LEDRQGCAGTPANEGREGEWDRRGEEHLSSKREGYRYKHISYDKTHMLKELPGIKECMQNTETSLRWKGHGA
jgi:hypothetical protein